MLYESVRAPIGRGLFRAWALLCLVAGMTPVDAQLTAPAPRGVAVAPTVPAPTTVTEAGLRRIVPASEGGDPQELARRLSAPVPEEVLADLRSGADAETLSRKNRTHPAIRLLRKGTFYLGSSDPVPGALAVTGVYERWDRNQRLPDEEVWRWDVPEPWQDLTMVDPFDSHWVRDPITGRTTASRWLPVALVSGDAEGSTVQRLLFFDAARGFQWASDLDALSEGGYYLARDLECSGDGNAIVVTMNSRGRPAPESASKIVVFDRSGRVVRQYTLEGMETHTVSRSRAGGVFTVGFRVNFANGERMAAPAQGHLILDRSGTLLGALAGSDGRLLGGFVGVTPDDTEIVAPRSGVTYSLARF